ncbi:MAG TPA: ribonuclease H-like YkuK family protein, partial [Flavisolibacter sp.]|nr:ribonuclease H-like YkuK family protein [Flavisolibacter sp.]
MEQQQTWRKLDGTRISAPIAEEVRAALIREKTAGHQLKVCIGTDSQVKGNVTEFATVIVFIRQGVEVNGFGIRDIILPGDVKEIMNQALVAEKKAQANTIMRREETASTRSLLNTAKLMEENTMLWKLKEMEYVS